MKQGKTDIVELAKAIQHEADNKKDYVSPSQLMSITSCLTPDLTGRDLKVVMQSTQHEADGNNDCIGEKIEMSMSTRITPVGC